MSWKRLSGVSKKSNDQEEDTSSQKSLLTAALFEDKWSKITESHLKVKNYFFPTAQSKVGQKVDGVYSLMLQKIPIKSIQAVFYEQQDMLKQACMVKGWGMAYTPVWWACDCKRLGKNNSFHLIALNLL